MRKLILLFASCLSLALPALAAGSIPLADVLVRAKDYPNLALQVRLQLIRAQKKKDQVTCTGQRFGNQWLKLGGERVGPYECPIGKRTLTIRTVPLYEDGAGYRLRSNDPDLARKAARVRETRFTWSWR